MMKNSENMNQRGFELKKERRNIRIVFLIFSGFFMLFAWRHYPSISSCILICLVVIILPITAFSPIMLRPVFKLWMKLTHVVGWFNTQVILTVVFIVIFIPVGLIMKLLRRDPMKRKMLAEGTYWEPYELGGLKDRNRYERQF